MRQTIDATCLDNIRTFMSTHNFSTAEFETTELPITITTIAHELYQRCKQSRKHHSKTLKEFFTLLAACMRMYYLVDPDLIPPYFSKDMFLLLSVYMTRKNYDDKSILTILTILNAIFHANRSTISSLFDLSINTQITFLFHVIIRIQKNNDYFYGLINHIIHTISGSETLTQGQQHDFIKMVRNYWIAQAKQNQGRINFMDNSTSILPIVSQTIENDASHEKSFWSLFFHNEFIAAHICNLFRSDVHDNDAILLKYFLLFNRKVRTNFTLRRTCQIGATWARIEGEMMDILFGRTSRYMPPTDVQRLAFNIKTVFPKQYEDKQDRSITPYLNTVLFNPTMQKYSQFIEQRFNEGDETWPMRLSVLGDEKDISRAILSIQDPRIRRQYIEKVRTLQKGFAIKKKLRDINSSNFTSHRQTKF